MSKRKYLPEIRVKLELVRPGDSAIPLDYSDNLGMRTKLGGEPNWIQGDDTPLCADCGKEMVFVAQIDSIEHENVHNPLNFDFLGPRVDEFTFGDVGMIYVFFCFHCYQPSCLVQCH